MKKISLMVVFMLITTVIWAQDNDRDKEHLHVDLGLPSGTLWAFTNLGAALPEDFGDYYAWGEVDYKSDYSWNTYKYVKGGDATKFTKYCAQATIGNAKYTDTLVVLEAQDDVATQKWGADWCMPTREQFDELKKECTWKWTVRNGKNIIEITGKNGNKLYMPAAGCHFNKSRSLVGSNGYYWSSSISDKGSGRGACFTFSQNDMEVSVRARNIGNTIRPVRSPNYVPPAEEE
ncbi:MAG: hypothetical protein J5595_11000 [Bacteroidales bacterium]|nr:hypothetical protein [Bacteroidales bacterium]